MRRGVTGSAASTRGGCRPDLRNAPSEVIHVVHAQDDLGPAKDVGAPVGHVDRKVPDEAGVDPWSPLRQVRDALLEAV